MLCGSVFADFTVNSCQAITLPGTYVVQGDLSGGGVSNPSWMFSYDTCIGIQTSNVVLDCNSSTILVSNVPDNTNDYGIATAAPSNGYLTNITIKNCAVVGNTSSGGVEYGAVLWQTNNSIVTNSSFTNLSTGVQLDVSYNDTVLGNSMLETSTDGIAVGSGSCISSDGGLNNYLFNNISNGATDGIFACGDYDNISDNIIYSSGAIWEVGSNSSIINNTVSYSSRLSIGDTYSGEGNLFQNNIAHDNNGTSTCYELDLSNDILINNTAYNCVFANIGAFHLGDNVTAIGNQVYNVTGDGFYDLSTIGSTFINNTVSNITSYGYMLTSNQPSGSPFLLINNKAYNASTGFGLDIDNSLLENNTAINCTNDGFHEGVANAAGNNTFIGTTAFNNSGYGISSTGSPETFISSNVSFNTGSGIYLRSDNRVQIINTTAYSNGGSGIDMTGGTFIGINISVVNTTAYNNLNSGINLNECSGICNVTNAHLFNNTHDFAFAISAAVLNVSDVIFDSPAGNFVNYTNMSLWDNFTYAGGYNGFYISWTPEPASPPSQYASFRQKYLNFTLNPLYSTNDMTLQMFWNPSEESGYAPSGFQLYMYDTNSHTWTSMNSSPDLTNRVISTDAKYLLDYSYPHTFGILQGPQPCPMITTNGTYVQTNNLQGAPNPALFAPNYACVVITASNVVYNCNGYNITGNGSLGTFQYGFLITGATNVTVLNCPNISNYYTGMSIQSSNSVFANITINNQNFNQPGLDMGNDYNNTVINVTTYGIGTGSSSSQGFWMAFDSNNTFVNSAAYGYNKGFLFTQSFNDSLINSTESSDTVGIMLDTSRYTTLSGNNISNDPNSGIQILSSNFTTISNNLVYDDIFGMFLYRLSNNPGHTTNTTFFNNSIFDNPAAGVKILDSYNNTMSYDHFYSNNPDFEIIEDSNTSVITLNMTNETFDNPSGDYANFTTLSLGDQIMGESYSINWSAQPPTLPANEIPFDNKFINISTNISGSDKFSVSILNSVWSWTPTEASGHNESAFDLFNYSGTWSSAGATLGTHILNLSGLGADGVYGIMQYNPPSTGCPLITSPGAYTQTIDYFGASNDASEIGYPANACVKIAAQNVTYDCNDFNITDDGSSTAPNNFGIFINGSASNVTVENCLVSNYTDDGASADIVVFNSSYDSIVNSTAQNSGTGIIVGPSTSTNAPILTPNYQLTTQSCNYYGYCTLTYTVTSPNTFVLLMMGGGGVWGGFASVSLPSGCTQQQNSGYYYPSWPYYASGGYVATCTQNPGTYTLSAYTLGGYYGSYTYLYPYQADISMASYVFSPGTYDYSTGATTGVYSSSLPLPSGDGLYLCDGGDYGYSSFNPDEAADTSTSYSAVWHQSSNVCSATGNYYDTVAGVAVTLVPPITISNATIDNNTIGLFMNDSGSSSILSNEHFYNNGNDMLLTENLGNSMGLNANGLIFDNPSGNFTNYTNISISDSVLYDAYSINWSAQPAPLLPGFTSFAGKFVNITTVSGSPSIESVTWNWNPSELSPQDMEYAFTLNEYNSSAWYVLNDTPDTVDHALSIYGLIPHSVYGILEPNSSQYIDTCMYIDSSGSYSLISDLFGAPFPFDSNGPRNACIVVNASDINLDCQGHSISPGGNDAIGVDSQNNVTVENCNLIGNGVYPSTGVQLSNTTNSVITDNNATTMYYGFQQEAINYDGAYDINNQFLNNFVNSSNVVIDSESNNLNSTYSDNSGADINGYDAFIFNGEFNSTITGNSIEGYNPVYAYDTCSVGFDIYNGAGNNYTGNSADNCSYEGFDVYRESNDTFISNNATNDGNYGFYLTGITSVPSLNLLQDNLFYNNGYGLYLRNSPNNTVIYNNFTNNGYGFYLYESNNNQIGNNNVFNSTSSNSLTPGSSCPYLYSWNGTANSIVTDISAESGILGTYLSNGTFKHSIPGDYAEINSSQLQPQNNAYNVDITEELNEISYVDQISLLTVDHSPSVDVFPGLLRNNLSAIYTVSKNPLPPVSCVDAEGNDCISQILSQDGVYAQPENNSMTLLTMDLGNLSNASSIKLILSGYSTFGSLSATRYIQVLNSTGGWVSVYDNTNIKRPSGLPRTYVVDMTGKFLTDNYSIRLGFVDSSFDYIAVDTSPDQPVSVNYFQPVSADLHDRGISETTNTTPPMPQYYNTTNSSDFGSPSGSFTRYGEVAALLNGTDDEYVIMHSGDEMSVSFPATPVPLGQQRDFLLYSYVYYKPMGNVNGTTVNPLPFQSMSNYPYPANQHYPNDTSHQDYLSSWNTRNYTFEPSSAGASLPYSFNNSVYNNTIFGGPSSTGLYLINENDTNILTNNISGVFDGIKLDASLSTFVNGNNVSDNYNDGILVIDGSNGSLITFNTAFNDSNNGFEIDQSDNNLLDSNNATYNGNDGFLLNDTTSSVLPFCPIEPAMACDPPYYQVCTCPFLSTYTCRFGSAMCVRGGGGGSFNNITNSIALNNTANGFELASADNDLLLNNNASNNQLDGFFLNNAGPFDALANNTASGNALDGFELDNSTNDSVDSSNATTNGDSGFVLWYGGSSNSLTNNIAFSNAINGFYTESESNDNISSNLASDSGLAGMSIEPGAQSGQAYMLYSYNLDTVSSPETDNFSYNVNSDGSLVVLMIGGGYDPIESVSFNGGNCTEQEFVPSPDTDSTAYVATCVQDAGSYNISVTSESDSYVTFGAYVFSPGAYPSSAAGANDSINPNISASLPSGYDIYLCAGSAYNDILTSESGTVDASSTCNPLDCPSGPGPSSVIWHQTSDVCSVNTTSGGTPVSLAGIGINGTGTGFPAPLNTYYNDTVYNNNVGLLMNDSGDNSVMMAEHLYNNSYDMLLNESTGSTLVLNASNIIFDNPAGDYTNFTNLTINDLLQYESYSINWSLQPAPLPAGYASFAGKFVNISSISGSPSIDDIVWSWIPSELNGYNESGFQLFEFDGAWAVDNDTPDTTAHTLSLFNKAGFSVFGILDSANVSVIKLDQTGIQTSPEGVVQFNITVTNNGDVALNPVQVIDNLPQGLTFGSASPSPNFQSGQEAVWDDIGSLGPGASQVIYLNATVDPGVVNSSTPELNLTNDANTTGVPLNGNNVTADSMANVTIYYANVTVVKADITPVLTSPGGEVQWLINISNPGEVELNPVLVTDTLPPGFLMSGSNPFPDSSNGTTMNWTNVGPLTPGSSATIYLNSTVAPDVANGTYYNTVNVLAVPINGDNVTASDSAMVGIYAPGINIIKTANPASGIQIGANVTYNLNISNTGAVNLTVSVEDTLPMNVNLDSSDHLPTSVDGQVVRWVNVTTLTPGSTFTINYDVSANASGIYTNDATAIGVPPNGNNVSDNDSTTITVVSNITAPCTDCGGHTSPGLSFSFKASCVDNNPSNTVTVTSSGPVSGASVVVNGNQVYTTDSRGRATFPGCDGSIDVSARADGYIPTENLGETLLACNACAPVVPPINVTKPPQPPVCTAPTCCTNNSQCQDNQACLTSSGAPATSETPGSCQNITGECGVAAGHTFVPYNYQCGDEPGCPSCPDAEKCMDHVCVAENLSCPTEGIIGDTKICAATQNGQPLNNCSITFTDPNGRTYSGACDPSGNIQTPPLSIAGIWTATLLQNGTAVRTVTITALPKSAPIETPKPVAITPDYSWLLWLLVLLVIIILVIIYWRRRSKKK